MTRWPGIPALGRLVVNGLALCVALWPGPGNALANPRPNILLCISDDQSWAHTSATGDPVVKTPAFDRIAREGCLFTHAFCDAPSCAPSRSALLTGQPIWRLEEAGNLHSRLPEKFETYVRLLERSGYVTGSQAKAWAPGQVKTTEGWVHNSKSKLNPAGPLFESFNEFLAQRPAGRPFCFWLGSHDAHRPYAPDSGVQAGMNAKAVIVPGHLPDDPIVRRDMLDYYGEIQRFDQMVANALAALDRIGELDNTLIVVTSDNGMPFPRSKATLYDFGTRVPLAIRWPGSIASPGRKIDQIVQLSDLAATFIEAAGEVPPPDMTSQSLVNLLSQRDSSDGVSGQPETKRRDAAFTAMERHDGCRPGGAGYPCRAIRTREYLYIRNYAPGRWPAGHPDAAFCARAIPFGEVDSSPTKLLMMESVTSERDAPQKRQWLHELAFGKRPAEELYDLNHDPAQLNNIASKPEYASTKKRLAERLERYLRETGDPRALGQEAPWDHYPYYGVRINKDWKVKQPKEQRP